MASVFDSVLAQGDVYAISGKFNFDGVEYAYEQGFRGYFCRQGTFVEGVVEDLYSHPSGVSRVRYLKGTLDASGELSIVKMANHSGIAPLLYKGKPDGDATRGFIGTPKWEEAHPGGGLSGLSVFAEVIKFAFNGRDTFEVKLEPLTNPDEVVRVRACLVEKVAAFKAGKLNKSNHDFIVNDLMPVSIGERAGYYK